MSYQPADASGAVLLAVQASRALAAAGQGDMVWGHASIRDPGGRGAWMKSAGWGLEEIDASRVALVSPDGEVDDGAGPRHIEYPIHTEIMAARPDVGSVVHTHSPAANEFAALDVPLRPLDHAGSLFCYPDIPRFTLTGGLIKTRNLGAALAGVLGEGAGLPDAAARHRRRRPRCADRGHDRRAARPGLPDPADRDGGGPAAALGRRAGHRGQARRRLV